MKTAADVMTKHVVKVDSDAPVSEAIDKMKHWNVSSLLVRRKESTDTWGFMTQTDVIEKVIAEEKDPEQVLVYEIMTKIQESLDAVRQILKTGLGRDGQIRHAVAKIPVMVPILDDVTPTLRNRVTR